VWAYAREVSAEVPVASDTDGMHVNVRMAKPAVDALHDLPVRQERAVAQAIRLIGIKAGVSLEPPGDDGMQYMVMIPDDDHAPVVIYRERPKLEGGGYLVTGLLDRDTYSTYTRTAQPGFLETPAGKAVLGAIAVGAAAIGFSLGSRSGKPSA
jgi:hypothetical protein